MLRVLFCITCCGAPPHNRPSRGQAVVVKDNEKLVEKADFKSLISLGTNEKDQLLPNQIQANNGTYGTDDGVEKQQGRILSEPILTSTQQVCDGQKTSEMGDSFTASTSAKQQTILATSETNTMGILETDYEEEQASVTPPSSIDVSQYRETQNNDRNDDADQSVELVEGGSQSVAMASSERRHSSESHHSQTIQSTTKIGDYARLEYSPVEDLYSVTTKSPSRGGSDWGGQQASQTGSGRLSRKNSSKAASSAVSRSSSRGIESTSISIASQLSNEQLQQNLTNMLESANSPIPMFGTIGLPLGPPLEGTGMTETAKTSPETTGAALTSASQDSLSNASLGSEPASNAATYDSSVTGAALVERAYGEDSVELSSITQNPVGDKPTSTKTSNETPVERLESSLSMATTTTSGGLTNPTPTPSELSTGSTKKKKLRAKSLLKRFKPGKKKSKDKENEVK